MSVDRASCAATDFEAIERSFPHNKRVSEQYVRPETLEYVKRLIPGAIFEQKGGAQLHALLHWFKNDFMRWLPNQINCSKCGNGETAMRPTIQLGSSWQLRKVESYTCDNCGAEQVYTRFSDV